MSRSFRLAGLLRVRAIQAREAAAHLSRAAIDREHTEARERSLRASLAAGADQATDLRTLAALSASRVASRRLFEDLRTLAETQDARLADAQRTHTDARVGERGLERLADAHARQEQERALRAEQLDLDEIALRPPTPEIP